MQARIVPAIRGARWLARGWRLFRAAPLGWLALVFTYWLLMTLISVVPLVGVVAASVLVPPFSIAFMAAARAADRGAPVELPLLFEGFREGRGRQLVLGAVYTACIVAVLAASGLADGGALARWMLTGERPAAEVLQSDAFFAAMALAIALYAPVMMMFWFAPVLAAWHRTPPPKAIFFSFAACLMNWRAFLAYGVATGLVTVAAPLLALGGLMAVLGTRAAATSLVFPLLLVLMPTLFASFYASYEDIFGPGE